MSVILDAVIALAARGEVRPSLHAYRELAADHLLFEEVIAGIGTAVAIEEYPDYFKGPCVLALHRDSDERPVHALWGIPKHHSSPAVLITAYRPDPALWVADYETEDGMTRRTVEFVQEGKYAAEVPVDLIEDETGWSPYLSMEDAQKLDAVRRALREGDVAAAGKLARVFELLPISA